MIISEQDYLEHYGTKGMKWGIRKDVNSSNSGSKTTKDILKKNGNDKVGANPTVVLVGVYGAALGIAIINHAVKMRKDSGRKDAKQIGDEPFKENPKLKRSMDVKTLHKTVVKPINKDYPDVGTKMNCRRCTVAYEMRRRGLDVKATKSLYASGQTSKGLRKATNTEKSKYESRWGEKSAVDLKTFNKNTPDQKAQIVFDAIGKHPSGARGELGVGWTFGGGHSLAWEVVNNKPVIFDTQNGETYATPQSFSKFSETIYDAGTTRLDNKPIDDEFVRRWVTNV